MRFVRVGERDKGWHFVDGCRSCGEGEVEGGGMGFLYELFDETLVLVWRMFVTGLGLDA